MYRLLLLLALILLFGGCTAVEKTSAVHPAMAINSPAPIQMVEPRQIKDPTRAIVIFNGFPSYYTNNGDFAYVLAARMQIRAFIIDYKGLKHFPGKFSFIGSITDAKLAVGELKRKFGLQEVYLVGHSWGGAVALNVMREYPGLVKKSFLLAPLLGLRSPEDMASTLKKTFLVQNELPTTTVKITDLQKEIPALQAKYMPFSFGQELRGQIMIAHNQGDKELPMAGSQKFAKLVGDQVEIIESGASHWLSEDRPGLLRKAQAFFQN